MLDGLAISVQCALSIIYDTEMIVRVGAVCKIFAKDALVDESVCDVQITILEYCTRIRELLVERGH